MNTRHLLLAASAALALATLSPTASAGDEHYETCDEGCTPGYWKQSQHFDSWPAPYTPDSRLRDVFVTSPVTLVPDHSFLQALNYTGGTGIPGATRILLRAAVAALLNSSAPDVNFAVSTGHVIDTTINRIETQWRPTLLTRAAYFDSINNGPDGCPLD
ncbi:hypothetical protein GCM10028862_12630 [Luteimonas pelagia]